MRPDTKQRKETNNIYIYTGVYPLDKEGKKPTLLTDGKKPTLLTDGKKPTLLTEGTKRNQRDAKPEQHRQDSPLIRGHVCAY
jgi:hypothetical protein